MNPLLLKTQANTTAPSWQDRLLTLAARPKDVAPTVHGPSVVYAPSAAPAADATYSDPTKAAVDPSSDEAIGALLTRNSTSGNTSGIFAGLGQALLGRFVTDGANFNADAAGATGADGAITLGIRTASGATVKLGLTASANGVAVSLNTDRSLSAKEKQAIAGLASAFQDAVDGLAAQPPALSLDGLLAADTSVLSAVDLNATVATAGAHETIALHLGSDSRSLKVDGPAGSIAMNLDMSQPATWGNRTQRDAAVANYLDQVDAAANRGHADKALVALFKAGFSQLNSHYPPNPADASTSGTTRDLSSTDHAMLTGLADFNASVSQATSAPNPRHADELDTFNYELSQSTTLSGANAGNRHISQVLASKLTASFHTSPWPDTPLNLTDEPNSQNYNYTQIDDSAQSTTDIAYAKGRLVAATISHTAKEQTRVRQYMVGKLIDDTNTPSRQQASRDLLPLLGALARPRADGNAAATATALDTLHGYTGLQADPAQLRPGHVSIPSSG